MSKRKGGAKASGSSLVVIDDEFRRKFADYCLMDDYYMFLRLARNPSLHAACPSEPARGALAGSPRKSAIHKVAHITHAVIPRHLAFRGSRSECLRSGRKRSRQSSRTRDGGKASCLFVLLSGLSFAFL